ncbi:hypothetical protein BVG79_01621 [Ketogulonicigenium robustum]|uniref:Glutamine amidotransferase domain-containing protein n=1 Tax=Ketogulonicigenium robustum TaxID=92947 RepID=A0A1W6P0D0_9RHOB|nr:hypothetical protein [Ketogulonicigenium robustum]ARO14965.1 hypothetical protein BVG79_01621 [Ketogulonicigenium robustum]
MNGALVFSPLLGWPLVAVAGAVALLIAGLALWRGLAGWGWRALAAAVLTLALANPVVQQETRAALSDIVVVVVDRSASQRIGGRAAQTDAALAHLQSQIAALPNTELRLVEVSDAQSNDSDGGTRLLTVLSDTLAEEPAARVAGIILLTDGRVHDVDINPQLPAPTHIVLTGQPDDWDRRLIVRNAPAFAILDEPIRLTLRIDDQGAAPQTDSVPLTIAIDGGEPMRFTVPVGRDIELPVTLPHGGMNVLQFETPAAEGELTDRNNAAVVQINGVRDRLRVMLVSGEPHAGERTWRNLLKSDPAVDLVHFTILRPSDAVDPTPTEELALIAFPTRELFVDKINDFDLIIFDRDRRRGLVPDDYMQNVANYVRNGGAVLVSTGPEFAGAESIARSPLAQVLPARPSGQVFDGAFRPQLTELGQRHPVTAGLPALSGVDEDGNPLWGHWLRLLDVKPTDSAEVVMSDESGHPLLVLDRAGEGRVALLSSDQAWLWARGFEGGGPQNEFLRRLAHWLMKEPDLEEEALWAEPQGQQMRVIRRTMEDAAPPVTITLPDGSTATVTPTEVAPGRFESLWTAPEAGLYRLTDGTLEAVIAVGPAAPREFEQTIATADILSPLTTPTGGGTLAASDSMPDVRTVRANQTAFGPDWIGITPRDVARVTSLQTSPVLAAWAWLLIAAGLMLIGWLREGRRGGAKP